ncbi:hypothetical protein M0R45_022897 [Rubus argutus]|uniref:Pentatricopeptide repeat-containing protein n=1 Tax=Rubus argutus TaxID=59490 RepID=A0AAW1WNU0_RUBAR
MQQAKSLLDEMIGKGILPDEILIVCLVRKYYELGNVDEAIKLQTEWRNRALRTELLIRWFLMQELERG